MPIHKGKDKDGCFYQWGGQAKYHFACEDEAAGSRAKAKAEKQARAIEISKHTDMKNNFKYIKNFSIEESEATILLYNTIGCVTDEVGNTIEGINGEAFAKELEFLNTQVKTIHIRINSPGGNVMDGFSIISAMKNSTAKICTHNDGIAASIAGLILVAGDERYGKDYSITMIHNPASESADDTVLEKIKESLMTILENNSIYNKETLNDLMNQETYFNAVEARDAELIDEIEPSGEKFNVATKNTFEMAAVFNSLINKTEMKSKKKDITINIEKIVDTIVVENKLGLESPTTLTNEDEEMAPVVDAKTPDEYAEEANENGTGSDAEEEAEGEEEVDDKITAMSKLKNEFGMGEEASDDDVYDSIKSMKDDLEKTKATLADMVKEAKSAHKQRIDSMVNNLVITKKITKDEVVNVTKLAEADFETTKNLFEKISTVSKHTSISNTIKSNPIITAQSPKSAWTIRDYEKKDPAGLAKIKNENPLEYTRLYNDFYNNK
jgi:ATP-dependent protease ClpP protease subunit